MSKKRIHLDPDAIRELRALLPYGALTEIRRRLVAKGTSLSMVSVNKFRNQKLLEEIALYLKEAPEREKAKRNEGREFIKGLKKEMRRSR